MEFLTAIIPVILEPFVAPITSRFGYAFRFRSKVNALRDEVQALQGQFDIMLNSIAAARRRGEVAETYVLDWQARAETAIAQAETVIRSGDDQAQRGCSLKMRTKYKIGKQAADGTPGIVRLREEVEKFGPNISRLPDLQQILPPTVEGYEAESRTVLLNKVMTALSDPNVAMVGVHGLGGIGKTTLAKEVHRQATQIFDKVVLATVTATPELRRIQDEIAEFVIGLKLEESTDSARASRLHQNLKDRLKDTKILIILDDIWDRLELCTVGIPTGHDGQGCKILLTSRKVNLLSDMGSRHNFPIEHMSEKESMSLFEKEVTEVRDFKIAGEILVKCGGFPLLIVTVAGFVRNKGFHAMKDALTQLSKFDNQEIHDKVYSVLNLSYDSLPCEETKSIFLLCGICSRTDTAMLNLLRYSMGLGLLKNYTISGARSRLETLIDDLKACSLLDVDCDGRVKMHDVVRDMCIAHKDQHAFRHSNGNMLKEWPDKGDIGSCTRVSLPYSDIQHLPEDLGCRDVEFLLFFSNWPSINIPYSTFQRTKRLKAVHFTGIDLSSLPGSLQYLTNLHTLCLERCHLLDVAVIGQLKTLEILSFRGSDLDVLPNEMGHLNCLKVLDLSNCSELDFIPADVISRMTSLEELLMINSFDSWENEESTNRRKARLSELKCLSRLTSLEICVPNVQALPKSLFFSGLERYEILIGQRWTAFNRPETTKTLKLKLNTDSRDLLQKFGGLLEESEKLYLQEVNGLTNLLYELDNKGFPKLKELYILDTFQFQQIVDCRKRGATTVCFPLLERLELRGLKNVLSICQGQLAPDSFGKIKKLHISGCHRLKNLMSLSMIRSLSQIEVIDVSSCNEMEAVFVEESDCGFDGDEAVELPRLRSLELWDLPKLKRFLYAPSSSDKLMSLFCEKVALPNLEELQLRSIGNIKMIWCNKLPWSSFGKLNSLGIYECHVLLTVFPVDVVERFQNLKSLVLRNCSLLEEIYQFRGEDSNNNEEGIFGLNSFDLPRLKRIWSDDQYSTQELESVLVSNCESLKDLFPLVIAESLSKLKSLQVRDCNRLEEIVVAGGGGGEFSKCPLFPRLASLTLTGLPELMRGFHPDSYTWNWPNLESVTIQSCPKTRIFGVANNNNNNAQTFFSAEKVFPNLEKMCVDGSTWKSVLESQPWLTRLKTLELSSVGRGTLTEASQFGSIPTVRDLVVRIRGSRIRQLWIDASLTRLELCYVKGLRYVWRPDSQMDPLLPYLDFLELNSCDDLISLAPSSSASFRSLSTLKLGFCSKMTELINPSTATIMTNLVTLQIEYCRALKEVVATKDDDDQTTHKCIIFDRLKTLELESMDSLDGFCVSSCYSFKFPCLEKVSICECPSMKIFCNGDVITHKLQNVDSQGSRRWEGNLNTTIKQLHQVQLQSITTLRLSKFPELVERCGRELPFRRFSNLSQFVVDKCPLFPPIAVPSNILPFVTRCRELVVEKCDHVEKILDLDGMDQNECHAGLMPRVYYLQLIDLPKLRHIWNIEDPLGISCFKNLGLLVVHNCSNLEHVFTLPVALGLVHLWKLKVKECALVEVIIKQQGDDKLPEVSDQITIFPSLRTMELEDLPGLMGFYSGGGGDIMRCPALDRVSVVGCPRMCLLRSTASSTEHNEINVSIMHDGAVDEPTLHIFNEQVEILSLKELVVQWNSSMDKAWHGIIPPSFLRSLEFVQLIGFPTVHPLLPSDFEQSMPNLFKFAIGDAFYKHRLQDLYRKMPVRSFAQLENLELYNLPELKHLVEKDSQLGSMFQHLRELRVSKCKGLTWLVASSTARSLVTLEKLVVKECERMTEIVSRNGDEAGDEIVFQKLQSLELDVLPCLTSFSSGDYTFGFPQLETVMARDCPNMRTFSKNIPSTPALDEVQIGEDDDEDAWRWEGGLNNTIEKLFTEKNPTSSC